VFVPGVTGVTTLFVYKKLWSLVGVVGLSEALSPDRENSSTNVNNSVVLSQVFFAIDAKATVIDCPVQKMSRHGILAPLKRRSCLI
jgi:hypothetical protein